MCLLVCFRSVKVLLSSSLPHPVSGCFLGAAAAVPKAVLLALQQTRGTAVPAASSAGAGGGAVAPQHGAFLPSAAVTAASMPFQWHSSCCSEQLDKGTAILLWGTGAGFNNSAETRDLNLEA